MAKLTGSTRPNVQRAITGRQIRYAIAALTLLQLIPIVWDCL